MIAMTEANNNTRQMFDDLEVEGENNEYGDEAFESEDPSPKRHTGGDELRNVGKGAKDSPKDVALPAFDNSSGPELEVRRCRTDRAHTAHTTLVRTLHR